CPLIAPCQKTQNEFAYQRRDPIFSCCITFRQIGYIGTFVSFSDTLILVPRLRPGCAPTCSTKSRFNGRDAIPTATGNGSRRHHERELCFGGRALRGRNLPRLLRPTPSLTFSYRTFPCVTIVVVNDSPSSRRQAMSFGVRTRRSSGNG